MMQAAPRKAHKKTRSGCVQCKRRKVKCGEEGCPCKNCIKRGISCNYAQSGPGDTPNKAYSSPRSGSQLPKTSAIGDPRLLHAALNRQEELCLVHHYTTLIHLGHSRNEHDPEAEGLRTAETWRDMPFRDGLTYAFVLDAVLAVAALHKAYMEPENGKKYMSACLYYQNQCLCAFQEQLADINQDNCHAIFAVAALIHILNFGISRGGPSLTPTPPIETLTVQLTLGRGIKAVLSTTWQTVKSAHYKDVFRVPGAGTPSDAVNSPEVAYAMDELKRCVTDSYTNSATTREILVSSVDLLERAFKDVEQGEDFAAITAWPVIINDNAGELVENRDPLMMLICINYGVLCLHLHNRWWAHNFGCRLIWDLSELLHALDASWLPLTSWARSRAASVRAASAQVQLW